MWAREPAVLAHYAHQFQTDEPLPPALLDKGLAAEKSARVQDRRISGRGLLASLAPDRGPTSAAAFAGDAFEKSSLQRARVDLAAVPPRYHSPYFLHVFNVGYDAAYYAYI